VLARLLRHEVGLRDPDLLVLGVARQRDDLHPVAQRRRHGVGHIRGGDEEHPREVERHVEVVVPKRGVLLGVEDLSSAAAGSPRKSMPSLSISSSMKTGFFVPARRSPWMIWPGNAPMYVRRWPRISASSRMPPSEVRRHLRPSAREIDRPRDRLPAPGGTTNA